MPLHVSSIFAHHQEVKIALHNLWYHQTEINEWSKIAKIQFYKYEQILFITELTPSNKDLLKKLKDSQLVKKFPKTLWSLFISVINQLDAQNFCFTISLFHACTCSEHMCSS